MGLSGLSAGELHGSLIQLERLDALEKFRDGKTNILLATDVAARGLDIAGVQKIINYHMPRRYIDYVHRVGRTARAGVGGRSVSLCIPADKPLLKQILATTSGKVKQRFVSEEAIAEWKEKYEMMDADIKQIYLDEQMESHMRIAERVRISAENKLKYQKELMQKPEKVWYLSPEEKKELKVKKRRFGDIDEKTIEKTAAAREAEKKKLAKQKRRTIPRIKKRDKKFSQVRGTDTLKVQRLAKQSLKKKEYKLPNMEPLESKVAKKRRRKTDSKGPPEKKKKTKKKAQKKYKRRR